jgi:hypothetical protein
MASTLYFHGHPINRKEAKNDVGLKIAQDVSSELEKLMWDLYLDFENDFQNRKAFFPAGDLALMPAPPQNAPKRKEYDLLHVMIESTGLSSRNVSKRRFTLIQPQPTQRILDEEILSVEWSHSPVA